MILESEPGIKVVGEATTGRERSPSQPDCGQKWC